MDYRAAAIEAAKRNGIDPNLFLRLVGQESAFKPGAVSPKGATGLGQLMPATARELGVDPTDPLQNLEGSARYFRQQMDTFGNPALALAAYNAGPGAVKKYGGIPPYKETQNYVEKILGANAPQTIAADTMRALGIQPRTSTKGGQPMAGLLGMGAMEEQKAPGFWDKFAGGALSDEDTRAKIAMWMQGMTMRPNQALVESLQQGIERRGAERKSTAERNATAEWLESQGMTQQAEAVRRGILTGAQALEMARGGEATAAQRNYEFLISQGLDPETALQRAFSGGTTINMPGAPTIGAIPQGYQAVQDPETGRYRFEPIEGGPVAAEQAAAAEQEEGRGELAARAGNVVLEDIGRIQRIIDESDLPVAGFTGALLRNVPGTNAYDVSALATTIRANIGFDRLQQMREASPTGGALGAVSERELTELQSVLGSLDQAQSQEQFERNLNRLGQLYTNMMEKFAAYPNASQFGINPQPSSADMSDEELLRMYGGQ